MGLPSTVSTNSWSDYKNSFLGPFPQIVQIAQTVTVGANEVIGTTSQEKLAQSFLALDGTLSSIDIFILKFNVTLPDAIVIHVYEDNSNQPGAALATGTTIPQSRISTIGAWRRSIFLQPPSLTPGTRYWMVAERTGSLSSDSYGWGVSTANPYADGKLMKFASGAWSDVGTSDGRFKINFRVEGRYQLGLDKTNNKIRMSKSTDGGNTFSEMDASNAPSISSTANLKTVYAQAVDELIHAYAITSGTRFDIQKFNTDNDTWGTQEDGDTSTTINTNVSGTAPLFGCYRPSRTTINHVAVYNGATETVMGNARRRIKLSRGPTWQATEFDVIGSANTPDATLPGLAVDYDHRAGLMDMDDVVHEFYTQSDDSNLHHRQFNANNTFSTANLMGSTPLTTSNSAIYAVGLPTNYYRNDEWRVAVPVNDGSTIKISRVAAASASTQSAWSNATAVNSAGEVTASNPCALVADNEQGGRLYLVFTKTDNKLYYTHDQGTDVWVTEQELHPGTKVVGGISANVLINAISVAYLDTSPTPDEIRYDHLDVFIPKGTLVDGSSITETRNTLVTSYGVQTDVDETASAVVTTEVSSSTADGEVPQLQCVIETQGGGVLGETIINPGTATTVETSGSGADAQVGITGL